MSTSADEIAERIQVVEDRTLELGKLVYEGEKTKAPHREGLADEVAAMANARGGTVVFGVDGRTRAVLGVPGEKIEVVMRWLHDIFVELVDPILDCNVGTIEVNTTIGDTAWVVVLAVEQGMHEHKSPNGYLHRVANSKRPKSNDFLMRLIRQRGQAHALHSDHEATTAASLTDLSKSLWEKYAVPRFSPSDGEMLLRLGILVQRSDGRTAPSVAGVLMCCERPDEYLGNAQFRGVAYRGESRDLNCQFDASDIVGPLDQQIVDACKFVERNMRAYTVRQPGRGDIPQYSMRAVFEVVLNAVGHRDCSVRGSAVRLHSFSDCIVLNSPGTLRNSVSVNNTQYRQLRRNALLTGLLARCRVPMELGKSADPRTHLMDKRGEGVPVILGQSEEISGRRPEHCLLDDAELMLTEFAPPPNQEDGS